MSEKSCSGSCSGCSSKGDCGQKKLTEKMNKIGRKIFVLSGKGGVGKSSVAASIAINLARTGRRVALLDADFHGPSQPTLFGTSGIRAEYDGESITPVVIGGVKLLSIGLLVDSDEEAVIWRGPAKMSVLKQLLEESDWGELDDLILDFPPGTGDEILSACQLIPGEKSAVIVTTPQEVSLTDCRKCIDFCKKVQLTILGIVENMNGFVCPDCGHTHRLFSEGGGKKLADKYGLKLLASLPLDPKFMKACDDGVLPDAIEEFHQFDELMKAF